MLHSLYIAKQYIASLGPSFSGSSPSCILGCLFQTKIHGVPHYPDVTEVPLLFFMSSYQIIVLKPVSCSVIKKNKTAGPL